MLNYAPDLLRVQIHLKYGCFCCHYLNEFLFVATQDYVKGGTSS